MTTPHVFKSPSGDELVILSRKAYEVLLNASGMDEEDLDDIAIYDARKAELRDDGTDLLPKEVSAFMLRGDSRLRAIRKWRGMSQTDLSAKSGVGQGYISDIEARRRNGSPETHAALARALDVLVHWLE